MRYHNEINVLKSGVIELRPGGVYNLNEDNEVELRVVKLHLLKAFADLCAEDVSSMAENHVVLGDAIEGLADRLFEVYGPSIMRGHDVFMHKDFFRPGKLERYGKLFEKFRATGKPIDYIEDYDGPGRVYMDNLHIGSTEYWPEEFHRNAGKWYLQIANQEWLSDDLEFLEYELFEFAILAGYFDEEV